MKRIIAIIITIFLIVTSSGCINIDNNENDGGKENYFNLWYSTSSDIEENVTIIIHTNGIEIFNKTIIPQKGHTIYKEKSSGKSYNVKAIWNNITSQTKFKPSGSKILFLLIREGNISFKVVQD